MYKLIQGDCVEKIKEIKDCSIDLTVTSPPYDNLRTYNGNIEQWSDVKFLSLSKELYRVTKNGGVVVWVVGDATIKGSETGTSFKQALHFMRNGFNLHDTMIYQKTKIVPCDPNRNRYQQEFEYMFVFSKGKPKTCNYIKVPCKHAGKKAVAYQYEADGTKRYDRIYSQKGHVVADTKIKGNIWAYASQSVKGHPAPFPEQLANDHIVSWSNPCDVVFDPFMGSGTTGKMSLLNGRNFIGIELDEQYFKISKDRIEKTLNDMEDKNVHQ